MIDQTQCSTLSFWTRFTLNPSSIINHQLLVVVFFTMGMFAVDVKVLPQLFSSELSTQSFTWSHLYWLGIHWPSWQVNWSDPHVCPPGGESYLLTLLSKKSTSLPRSCAFHRHTAGSLFIRAVPAVFVPIADKAQGDAFPACHTLEFLRAARRRCCHAHRTIKKSSHS